MSISSSLLSSITSFRNPNGPEQKWIQMCHDHKEYPNPLKVIVAEAGYLAMIPFAIIETALNAIAKIFSMCLPIGQENHNKMTERLKSSAFSILWAAGDSAINLFCNDMIETEKVARACAASGNIFRVPVEALNA